MWISQTAREAGVNAQTLRYYERRGLLPKPPRRGSGYREYPADAVRIVRFIKRAQELGFSLDEVEELVRLRGVRRGERHRVRAIAERKIADIDQQDRAPAVDARRARSSWSTSCHHGGAADCPIIDALNDAPEAEVMALDPVCGMTVDPARAAGHVEHDGTTYYFCSKGCVAKFTADPEEVSVRRRASRWRRAGARRHCTIGGLKKAAARPNPAPRTPNPESPNPEPAHPSNTSARWTPRS